MNREIKFRVWEPLSKSMELLDFCLYKRAQEGLSSHKFVLPVEEQFLQNPYAYMNLDTVKVMQYIGIKDNNGEDVYEGDIIKVWEQDNHVPNRDDGGGIIDFNREEGFSQLGVVSFSGGTYDYTTKKHISGREEIIDIPFAFLDVDGYLSGYEVVGNIYEHPHLLEENA